MATARTALLSALSLAALSGSIMPPNHNHQRWFPLESNPTLMNDYVQKLGFDTSQSGSYEFVDVFSTEDWALQMIPQPVAAVLVLYPLTDRQLSHSDGDKEKPAEQVPNVWFIKQRIGNACGTIGLLHTLMNVPEGLRVFAPGSWLDGFARSTHALTDEDSSPKDPLARAELLERDDAIAMLHDQATSSSENQTSRGSLDDAVETHFISLVHVQGRLYELDGRKKGPVDHGATTQEALLCDACRVVRELMQRDPDEVRFTILALAFKQS